MQLTEFNTMDAAEAAATIRPCVGIASWVDALVDGRPYSDLDALLIVADALARSWTGEQVEAALADHPRIGEQHPGSKASAAMSQREQSGVGRDAEISARLAAGNAAYERRFDRIFLVRAAGRDAEEILALLEQRLENDPVTELGVTAGQLREIAVLRLKGLFA